MDLGGTWKAVVGDEALRLQFSDPDLDEDGWEDLPVPGHWRSTTAFSGTNGPLLHRRRFEAERPGPAERAWLVFDGLFYLGDVWLDGTYLGDTEGYFNRHTFEITELAAARTEHLLAVEVTCSQPDDRTNKRNITGLFQDGESGDTWNPGGIWRPVRVERTGPVRARSLRVLCREADSTRAVIALRAELDTDATRSVQLRTRIGDQVDVGDHPLAEGSNFVEWTVTVPDPALWWPNALGDQPLQDITVDVLVDGTPSHTVMRRTGLRSVAFDDGVLSVNGERLFVKGARQGPSRLALAEASPDDLRRDIALAREAGLDLLRLRAHISRPELYDAADELGVLIWQDFPLHLGYSRGVRKQAMRQAGAAVDMLGHHPSIALWCAHDLPVDVDERAGIGRWTLGQDLPTWNRAFLDHGVRRAFEKADRSRPVLSHAGVHLWFGWFHGDEDDLASFARRVPRLVRFVTGLGAESGPDVATQAYQAGLVKRHIETLRRLKYRPTGGFCVADFADGRPGSSFAVLDHERNPKAAYLSLVDACRPLVVIADPPPDVVAPGEALALDVHVVSDLRVDLPEGRVDATISWPGGSTSWHWAGAVPADSCVRVGTIQAMVPDEPGELALDLQVVAGERVATNRYRAVIER